MQTKLGFNAKRLFKKITFIGVQLVYNVVLVSSVQQNESIIHIHVSTLLESFFPVYVITEHWVEFPVLHSRFLLLIYFIYNSVCILIPISPFIPPLPLVTISLKNTFFFFNFGVKCKGQESSDNKYLFSTAMFFGFNGKWIPYDISVSIPIKSEVIGSSRNLI